MRSVWALNLLTLCLLAACVTVNVYFPAAAAEQAADRIIDTVTSQPGGAKPNDTEPGKTPPQSRLGPPREQPELLAVRDQLEPPPAGGNPLQAAAGALLDLLFPAAHAQGTPDLDVSDPQIRAVTASMQQRFSGLKKYFDSGLIGLTADGQVSIRDQNAIPLAERAVVTRLVTEDNRDRATLYAELARANKHPEWEPDIRRTFARRWVERGAQPGWYYQDAAGNWVRK